MIIFQYDDCSNKAFLALSDGICQVEDDTIDSYWLTARLFELIEKHKECLPQMVKFEIEPFVRNVFVYSSIFSSMNHFQGINVHAYILSLHCK